MVKAQRGQDLLFEMASHVFFLLRNVFARGGTYCATELDGKIHAGILDAA